MIFPRQLPWNIDLSSPGTGDNGCVLMVKPEEKSYPVQVTISAVYRDDGERERAIVVAHTSFLVLPSVREHQTTPGNLTILKLTSWVCGTNLSTLGQERARARQTGGFK